MLNKNEPIYTYKQIMYKSFNSIYIEFINGNLKRFLHFSDRVPHIYMRGFSTVGLFSMGRLDPLSWPRVFSIHASSPFQPNSYALFYFHRNLPFFPLSKDEILNRKKCKKFWANNNLVCVGNKYFLLLESKISSVN